VRSTKKCVFGFQLSGGFFTFGHFKNVQFSFFQQKVRISSFQKMGLQHNAAIWIFGKNI